MYSSESEGSLVRYHNDVRTFYVGRLSYHNIESHAFVARQHTMFTMSLRSYVLGYVATWLCTCIPAQVVCVCHGPPFQPSYVLTYVRAYVRVQAVSRVLTEILLTLLDAGLLREDDVDEPLEVLVDDAIVPVEPPSEAGTPPGDGGLSPSPLELASFFGTRGQFRLGGLSIVHNTRSDGQNTWFALHATEVHSDNAIATMVYVGSYICPHVQITRVCCSTHVWRGVPH